MSDFHLIESDVMCDHIDSMSNEEVQITMFDAQLDSYFGVSVDGPICTKCEIKVRQDLSNHIGRVKKEVKDE